MSSGGSGLDRVKDLKIDKILMQIQPLMMKTAENEQNAPSEMLMARSMLAPGRRSGVKEIGEGVRGDNIHRSACTWKNGYLKNEARYQEWIFRRRFRIPKSLYLIIHHDLLTKSHADFEQRPDATKHFDILPTKRCSHHSVGWEQEKASTIWLTVPRCRKIP